MVQKGRKRAGRPKKRKAPRKRKPAKKRRKGASSRVGGALRRKRVGGALSRVKKALIGLGSALGIGVVAAGAHSVGKTYRGIGKMSAYLKGRR